MSNQMKITELSKLSKISIDMLIPNKKYIIGYFTISPATQIPDGMLHLTGTFVSHLGDIAHFNKLCFMPPDYDYTGEYNTNHYSYYTYEGIEYYIQETLKRMTMIKQELMEKTWHPNTYLNFGPE